MFRFAKQNRESFDLDYSGIVCAFDSGGDLIAICCGVDKIFVDIFNKVGIEHEIKDDGIGDPSNWDDWKIVAHMSEEKQHFLQRLLATAWVALETCEVFVMELGDSEE
jgi:hypothetical protein